MKMTTEQRKDLSFVATVLAETFRQYSYATADCGHHIFPETFGMVEKPDGQFVVLCQECLDKATS